MASAGVDAGVAGADWAVDGAEAVAGAVWAAAGIATSKNQRGFTCVISSAGDGNFRPAPNIRPKYCELLPLIGVVNLVGLASQHFRHALRRLGRSPMFALITLLTVAIGVGANSVIFSVVNGVLLKPLPYPQPEALVGLWQTAPNLKIKDLNVSPSDYFIFREQNRSFSEIGAWDGDTVTLTGNGTPEQVRGLDVTEVSCPSSASRPCWDARSPPRTPPRRAPAPSSSPTPSGSANSAATAGGGPKHPHRWQKRRDHRRDAGEFPLSRRQTRTAVCPCAATAPRSTSATSATRRSAASSPASPGPGQRRCRAHDPGGQHGISPAARLQREAVRRGSLRGRRCAR